MKVLLLIFQLILFIWFIGCITDYKIKKYILVEGMGIKSAEFIMLVLYGTGILLTLIFPKVGYHVVLYILVFWIVIQFFCHWYFTIFGASEKKLKGYNKCFEGTVRIFPSSEKRLVPDFYHIVLHLFIITNIVMTLIYLYRN